MRFKYEVYANMNICMHVHMCFATHTLWLHNFATSGGHRLIVQLCNKWSPHPRIVHLYNKWNHINEPPYGTNTTLPSLLNHYNHGKPTYPQRATILLYLVLCHYGLLVLPYLQVISLIYVIYFILQKLFFQHFIISIGK